MDSITHLYYPKRAEEGYRFLGNCSDNDVESKVKKYGELGYEVAIETPAYDFNTEVIEGMKAILIRDK